MGLGRPKELSDKRAAELWEIYRRGVYSYRALARAEQMSPSQICARLRQVAAQHEAWRAQLAEDGTLVIDVDRGMSPIDYRLARQGGFLPKAEREAEQPAATPESGQEK